MSMLQIRKVLRDVRPDYFHLQQTDDPRFLWVAMFTPTVLTLHEPAAREGVNGRGGSRRAVSRAIAWLYRRLAEVLVVHTQTSFQSLSASEQRKARVIPHGVKVSIAEHSQDSQTILFGRTDGYKGLDTLLVAMEAVWDFEPRARLQILASGGGGGYQVSDNRVSATWDGFSGKELEAALSAARAICLPYTTVSGVASERKPTAPESRSSQAILKVFGNSSLTRNYWSNLVMPRT